MQGFSGIKAMEDGTFWSLSDNGFGNKLNSTDAMLMLHHLRIDWEAGKVQALKTLFMRLLSAAFIQRYEGRILNIHPSLLPLFPGLHTHQRAIDAGMRIAGCTVHFVTEGMASFICARTRAISTQPSASKGSTCAPTRAPAWPHLPMYQWI